MDGNTSKWNSFHKQVGRLTRNVYQQRAEEDTFYLIIGDNVVKYQKAQLKHVISYFDL
jgi:hypothetical protein